MNKKIESLRFLISKIPLISLQKTHFLLLFSFDFCEFLNYFILFSQECSYNFI